MKTTELIQECIKQLTGETYDITVTEDQIDIYKSGYWHIYIDTQTGKMKMMGYFSDDDIATADIIKSHTNIIKDMATRYETV